MSQLPHQFEAQLAHIRDALLLMASLAERNLAHAMQALTERDDNLADSVEAEDASIDRLEISVDEMVINYMATHAPVARDCRFMLAASKISSNLERVGDQATTIARRVRDLNKEPMLKAVVDLPTMAQLAEQMLRESITAFIDQKPEIVPGIIGRDQQVDEINRRAIREMTREMASEPTTISRALCVLVIAKAIERIADHAKNIAEEVFYLYRAEDIRHERSLRESVAASDLRVV